MCKTPILGSPHLLLYGPSIEKPAVYKTLSGHLVPSVVPHASDTSFCLQPCLSKTALSQWQTCAQTLQEYDTYLAQMYLQTMLEEADTEQEQQQQPVAASTEGSSQDTLQQSGSNAAMAQQDAYAKLKRLVSAWVTADVAASACVLAPQPEAPQASACNPEGDFTSFAYLLRRCCRLTLGFHKHI